MVCQMSYVPLTAQGQCEYRLRLQRYTADPHFVSVALCDVTRVKSKKSSRFRYLKTYFDSKEIDCSVMSGPNCRQISIYLSVPDIVYRVLR